MATKEKSRSSRLRRNLTAGIVFIVVLIVSIVGYLSNMYGRFQQDFNRLSEAMANGDSDTVEKQMDAMVQYHDLATKWHLASFVDQHLLQNMYIYKAANTFLRGDYRSFNDDKFLIQKVNDNHLVANILGLAKARYYQSLYQAKLSQIKAKNPNGEPDKKDQADLEAILNQVIEEARPYFKSAVENSPGNDLYFEYPFNYDILQNKDSTRKALESPGPPGPEPMGYGDEDKPGKKPKTGDKKDKGKGGGKDGKPDKLNPGSQKPGGEGQPRKPKG